MSALRPAARSAQKTTCSWSSASMRSKRVNIMTPSQRDQDIVAVDLHLELFLLQVGVERIDAVRDVVLPAMPGAGDDLAAEFAFSQRPALVLADVINRI